MAWTYVGGTSGAGTGASYSVSLSGTLTGGVASSPAAGDLIVVFSGFASTSSSAPTVSGNTSGAYQTTTAAGYANDTWDTNFRSFYQVAGSTPDTTLTIGRQNNTTHGGATTVQVWRGVDAGNPYIGGANSGNSNNQNGAQLDPPSYNPAVTDALVIGGGAGTFAAADTSGYTGFASVLTNVVVGYGNGSTADTGVIMGSALYAGSAIDPPIASGGTQTNSNSSWSGVTLGFRMAPSAQIVSIGSATETSAAQTITAQLVSGPRTVVAFSRLSTLRTPGRLYGSFQRVEVGRTVVRFSRLTPIRTPGRLTGGFSRQASQSQSFGAALETDTAVALAVRKAKAVVAATSTELAVALAKRKVKAVGVATETNTALPIAQVGFTPVVPAYETDAAQTIGRRKVRTFAAAVETDSAQAVVRWQSGSRSVVTFSRLTPIRTPGRLTGSFAREWVTRVAIGPALETDTALAVLAPGKQRLVARYSRLGPITVSLRNVGDFSRPRRGVVVAAAETDGAVAVGRRKVRALGVATETDLARPLPLRRQKTLGVAVESDSAVTVARRKTKAYGQAAESNAAIFIVPSNPPTQVVVVNRAIETDFTPSIARRKVKALGVATDTSLSVGVGRAKVLGVGSTGEINASVPLWWSPKMRRVSPAVEIGVARSVRVFSAGVFVSIGGSRSRVGNAVQASAPTVTTVTTVRRRIGSSTVSSSTRIGSGNP